MNKVLIVGIVFLIAAISFVSFTNAYNPNFNNTTGNPTVFGHSADELDVKVPDSDGEKMTLQSAIDQGYFGGGSEGTGDIEAVRTPPESGLEGGKESGEVELSLVSNCSEGQVLKYVSNAWQCRDDIGGSGGGNDYYFCATGSSIRFIDEANNIVECEPDDVGGGGGNSFVTMDTPSGTDPQADSSSDLLQMLVGSGIPSGLTITGSSSSDSITFNLDATKVQQRVTGTCTAGNAIRVVNQDGTVSCQTAGPSCNTKDNCDSVYAGNPDITGDGGDILVEDDIYFYGEIRPDGSLCTTGQTLKKTGVNTWECTASGQPNCSNNGQCSNVYATNVVYTGDVSFNGELMPEGVDCGTGETLRRLGDNAWECSKPAMSCVSVKTSLSGGNAGYADCDGANPTGDIVTGGGVNVLEGGVSFIEDYPDMPNNRWVGRIQGSATGEVYAVCCLVVWSG